MIPEFTAVAGGQTENGFETVYGVDKRGRIWRLVIVAGGEAQRWQPLRSDGFDWADYPVDPKSYVGWPDSNGVAVKEGDKVLCTQTGEEGVVINDLNGEGQFVSSERTLPVWHIRNEQPIEVIQEEEDQQ